MRRVILAITVCGVLLGTTEAYARWVWRDGRWQYISGSESAPETPPAPPKAETPAPPKTEAPAPKPEQPAPKTEPTPKTESPARPKAETPAPKPEPVAPTPAAPTPVAPTPAAPPAAPTPVAPTPAAPPAAPTPAAPTPAAPTPAAPAAPAPRIEFITPKVAAPPAAPPKAAPPAEAKPAEAKEPAPEPSAAERFKSWWSGLVKPSDENMLFEQARAELSGRDYRGAARDFKNLIKNFPASRHREEALWLRAAALMGLEDYMAAFDQYEELLTNYAGSPHYHDALLKEIEIADTYFGPTRRKVLGIPLTSGDSEAVEILRKVYEHQPTGDLASSIVMKIADYYWSKDQWSEAEDYYDKYCREYPNGEGARVAELRRAKCAIERCRGSRYDTTCLQLAYDRLRQFRQKFPEEAEKEGVPALLEHVRQMQAESLYDTAVDYYRSGRPTAAAFYAERLMERYPGTFWSEKAREFLADISMRKDDVNPEEPKPEPPKKEAPKQEEPKP